MDEEDEPTDNDVYIKMRSSVYGVSAEMQILEDALSTAAPPNVKRREKPSLDDVTTGLLEVLLSITMVIRDYTTNQRAEDCLDTIKEYLIGMVESWNNNRSNLHTGISSIVNSFGSKKDYKYLSLRCPSNLDSGVGTCPSTSSLPRKSRPSRESPLATEPPAVPPRTEESLSGKPHKYSLQEPSMSHSVELHRNTVSSVMPVGEAGNLSATFPRTSFNDLPSRERRINYPMISHSKRSYVFPDSIRRRTSAPWKLASGLSPQPNPMDSTDHRKLSYHRSSPNGPPNLPQRSHSSVHRPGYPPPLPQRRHSESVSSHESHITASSRFSPTLDDFIEDEEEDNDEEAHYSIVGALEYIAPKQLIEGRPNIGKLQKKLWKRNSTLKKGRRPSVHKRSLTHSSDDASSDDSDAPKSKPKPQRRISSYHPTHRVSVTRPIRRKTAGSVPNLDSLVEDAMPKTTDVDQSSTLPKQAASEGDNEASEHNSGKSSGHKSPITPLISKTVASLRRSAFVAESDGSSDTDQEMFYPYHSYTEKVYDTAELGLAPEDRYKRLMGRCTNQENVMKAGELLKFSNGKKHWSKYWFEIRSSLLFCYKSKVHVNRRPKMSIKLNKWCKLTCNKEEEYAFEIETANNKCRLKATSQMDMDNWLVTLQKVLLAAESPYVNVRRNSSITRPKQTISGFLYLVEYELLCYRWANLDGRNLHFHTNQTTPPYTKIDLGHINLIRMKKLPRISGGEVSGKIEDLTAREEDLLIILIKHSNTADRYIIFEGKDNQLAWQYHLMQQCREVTGLQMTNTEKLICQLIEGNEPYHSTLWNHPTLMMNLATITAPLTSLPYAGDTEAAVKLNEDLLLYCSTNMISTALEYHIVSVQNMIQRCLQQPCFQNEFYCQVIRLTQSVTDPAGSKAIKAWQLLSFIIPVFLPQQWFLSYLEAHITRHITISAHSTIVEAAKYCRQLIFRTDQNGLRENIPSKFELSTLMSGLLENSTIATPLTTTVVFTDPQEDKMKIEFDSCTLVHEVLVKVRDVKKCSPDSEFTLTASWCDENNNHQQSDDTPEKFLYPIQKLCDVISHWTDVMLSCPTGNKLTQPIFTFKKRLFFKRTRTKLTNKEVTLLSHQFHKDVIENKFPAESDTYIKLTGLMAQMVCGDYKLHTNDIDTTIKDLLLQYLPSKMTTNYLQHTLDVMVTELKGQWKRLDQYKPLHCAMEHLKIGWKWLHFGSKLFRTQSLHHGTHLWLAVNEDGISELEYDTLVTKHVYSYNNILSFGQQEQCFKLVITQSNTVYYAETLLYIMSQLMIEEINGLTASYLERFLQTESDKEET